MTYKKPIIGVVVVSVPGANICIEQIANRLDHPEIISHVKPFIEYKQAAIAKDWGKVASLVLDSLNKLSIAGATFAIIPANTAYYAFDLFAPKSPIPILNLIDISVDHCAKMGYQKVTVLGTKQTMEDGLYTAKLANKNIEAVIPNEETQVLLHRLIMEELVPKGDKANTDFINLVIQRLRTINCDAFILGCTELPLVLNSSNLSKPVIDTTRLLGDAAVAYANQK